MYDTLPCEQDPVANVTPAGRCETTGQRLDRMMQRTFNQLKVYGMKPDLIVL